MSRSSSPFMRRGFAREFQKMDFPHQFKCWFQTEENTADQEQPGCRKGGGGKEEQTASDYEHCSRQKIDQQVKNFIDAMQLGRRSGMGSQVRVEKSHRFFAHIIRV